MTGSSARGGTAWTAPESQPSDGPTTGPDRPILEAYLDYQRATLLSICAGLTADQLVARPSPPSTLSLLGLVRHLAKVERIWLRQRIAGEDVPPLYGGAGDPTDFTDTDPQHAEAEFEQYRAECRSADAAVADLDFETECVAGGQTLSLRMVYVHLIGEYARHNGHADLLREALDGITGR